MAKGRWFGNDVSNRESLFEQGLLMRRINNDHYECVVFVGGDCYQFGDFYYKQNIADLDDENGWEKVGSIIGMSGAEYRKYIVEDLGGESGAAELAFDMIGYSGLECANIDYSPIFTRNEVKQRLGKALAA